MNDPHAEHSVLRERIVEHAFIAELLKRLWNRGVFDVEVLRSEFDREGHDLVLAHRGVTRHVQLKCGVRERPATLSLSVALAAKPSGCVVWISIERDLSFRGLHWFGAAPGEPLPLSGDLRPSRRIARTGSGERPERQRHRDLPGSKLERLEGFDALIERLFGALPVSKPA
jgi:hypothetical protein